MRFNINFTYMPSLPIHEDSFSIIYKLYIGKRHYLILFYYLIFSSGLCTYLGLLNPMNKV